MTIRGKTLALVLTGGVVLASGGYALGSQAGGGSAAAKDDSAREVGLNIGGPPRLDGMADRLGVTEERLSDALESLRSEQQPPDPDSLSKELAAALGVSQADLRAAMTKVRPRRGARTAKLCGPPGDAGAREDFRREGRGDPTPPARPGGPKVFFFGAGPGFAAAIAKELGLDKGKVEDALETFADKREAEAKERHDAFTQKLADKLGISVDKVEEALPAPFAGPRHP